MPILEVKNLSVRYGEQSILENISFDLEKGDTLAIIGPNGSGKTTLLRAILGATRYAGEIKISAGTEIGYVPQKIDLERDLPITVKEFLALRSRAESEGLLQAVDLAPDFLKKRIGELSAGELQRVLIAWAISGHPDLLLFDEPTASVDVAGQKTVYELLHKLQDERNLALILISHFSLAQQPECDYKVEIITDGTFQIFPYRTTQNHRQRISSLTNASHVYTSHCYWR